MTTEITREFYVIRNKLTKEFLYYHTSSNEGGSCCNDEQFILEDSPSYGDLYELTKYESAVFVCNVSTPWYNSSYNTPTHSFEPEELEILKRKEVLLQDTTLQKFDVKTAYKNLVHKTLTKKYGVKGEYPNKEHLAGCRERFERG